MNDNAKRWVEALRSGRYKQTRGRLKTNVGHCCLGVACELYAEEHPEAKWVDEGGLLSPQVGAPQEHVLRFDTGVQEDPQGLGRTSSESSLPDPVMNWLELAENDGMYAPADAPSTMHALINDNDGSVRGRGSKPFPEIADIIESEPEGLFK